MPKKPDRFELITMKNAWLAERMGPRLAILQEDVAKLLRNEHAWMRRQIKEIDRTRLRKDPDTPPNIQIGIAAALDDLERRLAQRRK